MPANPTSVQEAREQLLLGAEASLRQEYGESPRHPSTQRRYDRDWAVWVEEIDALIAAVRSERDAEIWKAVEGTRSSCGSGGFRGDPPCCVSVEDLRHIFGPPDAP